LELRPISLDHWEAYAACWADPRTTRFIGGSPRDRTTSWAKFLQSAGLWSVLGFGYWTFCDAETGHYLGTGGLCRFERGVAGLEGHVEAGWALAPDAWGKGYASEAMAAALDWADNVLHAAEVRCIIDHDNEASNRVATKLGFSRIVEPVPEMPEVALWRRERADTLAG
jgi:RimJ/RimL family protein N-acetyltransferase